MNILVPYLLSLNKTISKQYKSNTDETPPFSAIFLVYLLPYQSELLTLEHNELTCIISMLPSIHVSSFMKKYVELLKLSKDPLYSAIFLIYLLP